MLTTNKSPKISFIIPVYNVEKYLKNCLDSLINQTISDWQAICINDGSQDCSSEILKQYAKKDKRFVIINQENKGPSITRNNGVKHATAKYVHFFDSDDAIHPQFIESIDGIIKKEKPDVISFKLLNQTTSKISIAPINSHCLKYIKTTNPLFYLKKNNGCKVSITACTKVYKKSFIKNIPFFPNIYFEDNMLWAEVITKHPKTVITNETLYFYNQQNTSSITKSKKTIKHINDCHTIITKINNIYKKLSKKERAFIAQNMIKTIIKDQLKWVNDEPKLLSAYAKELKDLKTKGLLSIKLHGIFNWLKYQKIIKKAEC